MKVIKYLKSYLMIQLKILVKINFKLIVRSKAIKFVGTCFMMAYIYIYI